ncbi:Na(+)/H(+) exchange regulatory cofactor NHE-RF1 isoform X2 [Numida meleagris]|uniref:Na(+)/H(+) exchange regulatory cofactor NHE-RF1 isoform X2 n=1 Tax=Numida meleagris TaxID=8996 RepID=UPI000B3E1632|nr:Na(+)/H(+) exchange regulatory cofactor NHE-RF1 isoform X2 [Numida meleagris]
MATRGRGGLLDPCPVSSSVLWERGLVSLLFVVFAPGVRGSGPQPCCVFAFREQVPGCLEAFGVNRLQNAKSVCRGEASRCGSRSRPELPGLSRPAVLNGRGSRTSASSSTEQSAVAQTERCGGELRPRLCHIKKGPNGYGFNLHSDKSRPGQYVRAVDPDSPAEAAGLRAQDRIVEVNGTPMEGKQHADVVAAIKAGGDETKLLVVGVPADEFFKKCRVVPSEAHLAGPLPEPIANGDIEKENGGEPRLNSVSERPPSPALATSPEGSETHSEPDVQEGDRRSSAPSSLLDLDIPLAVAKERAHQKRTSKRAPQMDWSKKNELFSNL